jgi:MarR family transcriptional regulator, lower aerobic nicotinate degradation pathway regulator
MPQPLASRPLHPAPALAPEEARVLVVSFDRTNIMQHPAATATEAYVLEVQIGHLLRRAHQRYVSLFTQIFGVDGLTPMQYAALVKIGTLAEISQNLLGRLVAMDPATSQGVVKRLIEQGLVTRKDDPNDRRRALLSLTPAGQVMADAHIPLGRVASAETLAPLSVEERAQLLTLLAKIT